MKIINTSIVVLSNRFNSIFSKCAGILVLLSLTLYSTSVSAQSFAIVGNGTASNGSSEYPAPFGQYYYGARHQFFVTAAQLTAAGIPAGASISSIGFNVTATNGAAAHNGFVIRVYTTTSTNPISAGWVTTGLVAQTASASVSPVVGWNQRTLSASFTWNGTSNLVIETCFNNSGWTYNASTQWTTSGLGTGTWSRWYRADNTTVCSSTTTTSTSTTTRPNIRFGYTPPPPGCSALSSPANAATGVCYNGTGALLSWLAPTTGGAPTGYKVFFGTNNPPTNIVNGSNVGNVLSWSTGALSASTTYYWRIVPTNSSGDATSCNTVRSFTTAASACIAPGCAAYTAPSNALTGVSSAGTTLNWNAPTTGGVPTGYKVFFGTNNPPTNLVNGTNIGNVLSWNTPALSTFTTYYWRIVPTNGTGDASSCTTWSFTTGGAYCVPSYSNACSGGDFINGFSFNTINNQGSGCNGLTNSYINYPSSTHTTNVLLGSTYNLSMQSGGSFGQGFGVWVDWNQDTDFDDPGEFVYASPSSGTQLFSGTFTVPVNALTGTTRVRVRCSWNNTVASTQSCTLLTYGETEDYTITVSAPPAPNCATQSSPANAATGVCYNGTGPALSWTAPTGGGTFTGYKIYFGTNNPPTNIQNGSNIGNVLNWSTNTLSANTTYYWRVVPTGPGGDAVSCTVRSFTTASSPCVVPNCSNLTFPAHAATAVTANGPSLTWQLPVGGGTPTGYKIYFGTNNPPTNLQNGTNVGNVLTWATGALSPLTTYYWRVVPTNGTGDATGCNTVFSFTTGNVYCTSFATSSADTRIGNVTIGSINNTSPVSCQTYTDYTNLSTNLTIGNQVTASVSQASCGGAYGSYWSVFIDYNQNMDFNDPGELVGSFGSTNGSFTANSINFTIPLNALPGNTRMRVILIESSSIPTNPCATYSWGETEDYTVNLVLPPAPNCAVQSLPANAETGVCYNGNGPGLSWTAPTSGGPLTGYKMYFGTNNPPTNIQNGSNLGNVLNWSAGSLNANTTYYWQVVATGPGGDATACSVRSFTTASTPCVVPNCAALTFPANATTNVTANGPSLTWQVPVGGGTPTGYKVFFGTNNPPTNLQNGINVGNVLTWSTGPLNPLTTYYWRIVPTNGTGDAVSCNTVFSFTTGNVYCAPIHSNACSSGDLINRFTFNTISNLNSGCNNQTGNYINYSTSQFTTSVMQGSQYTMTMQSGGSWGQGFGVWIDWNQDMDFDDSGEFVYASPDATTALYSTNITIPVNALTGNTRVRVRCNYGVTPLSSESCTTFSWGETEDYTITITSPPAPSCATLSVPAQSATNVCYNAGVNLSWAAATGAVSGYKVFLGTNNPPTNIENGTNVGNVTSWTSSVLNAGTLYYWQIVPTGPGGDATACTIRSFTTAAAPCPVPNCLTAYASPTNGATNLNNLSGIQLAWNPPISGPTATGYKVYLGTNNPPTNLVNGQDIGNNTNVWFTAPQANTTYYWRIVPYASGGDATGCNLVYSFTTGSGYCVPSYSSGTGSGDYIGGVNIGPLNNITLGAPFPYYTYYSNLPVPLLQQSSLQTITVAAGTYSSGNNIAVWIDYNQNGVFETNEKVGEVLVPGSYPVSANINFTIPQCAPPGFTRMRVREVYSNTGIDPCSSYTFGETEDYNVEIQANPSIPSCATLGSPTNGTTNVSLAGTNLNWTPGTTGGCPTGYKLFFGTNNPPTNIVNGADLGNVVINGTGTLNPSTTYYWRIVPYNAIGDAINCNTVNAFTTCDLPAAPSGITASAITCTQFTLNWNAVSGATAYVLDVATDNGFTQPVSGFNGLNVGNVTTRNVTGLTLGTPYYYRIRTINSCGTGLNSATLSTTTTPIPAAPSVTTGTAPVCTGFSANWVLSTHATSYLLFVATDGGFTNMVSGYNGLNVGNVSTYNVTGLNPNATYFYRVVAVNACGNSSNSGTETGSTSPLPGTITLNSGSNPQCTSFDISWSSAPNSQTYSIDVATDSLFTQFVSGFNNLNVGSATNTSITGLTAGTSYYVRVRGNNSCGTGTYSNVVLGSTSPVSTVPVVGAASNVSCMNFDANWSAASHATQYRLDVATDNGFTQFVSGFNNLNVGNVTTYTVTGLTGGTQYYYRVKGENTCSTSAPSGSTTQVTLQLQDSVVVSGNSPVCEGIVLSISASSVNGATYSWSGPSSYTSVLSNVSISPAQTINTGMYSVLVSYPGCPDATGVYSATVSQPLIQLNKSANTPLCSGETLIMSASGGHYNTLYFWQGPDGFTSNLPVAHYISIPTTAQGVYSITTTSPGCNSMSDTLNVNVIPSISVVATNSGPICSGNPLYLNVTFVPGSPYLWLGPNGFSSQLRSPAISNTTIANSGIYTVQVNQPGCNPLSYITQVLVGSNVSQASITSNSPVCEGQTLNLSATHYPDAVYSWAGPNGYTANTRVIQIPNAVPSQSGLYTLTVTTPVCPPATRTSNVVVYPTLAPTAQANTPVCQGNSLQLQASSHTGATYRWDGPSGYSASSAFVNISSAQPNIHTGIYTLTVTQPACGVASSTVAVMVGGNFAGLQASSNSPICANGSLQLSGTHVANATYSWTSPDGFTASTANPVRSNMQLTSGGLYTMVVTSPGCGSTSRTLNIAVNTSATLTTGSNSPICQGGILNLTSFATSGATFIWQGPSGFSSTLQNPSITNTQTLNSGVYTLTASVAGCGSTQQTVSVQVGDNTQQAFASSNSPVCSGSAIQLSAVHAGTFGYTWSGPDGFASTIAQPVISSVSTINTGVYTLVTTSPGCSPLSRTVSVNVNDTAIPVASSNSPVCQSTTLNLMAGAVPNGTYSWTGPAGFNSTLRSPILTNTQLNQSGEYTLTVSVPGCNPAVATTQVSVGPAISNVSIQSNSPVCVGQNLQFTTTSTSGYTLTWDGPDRFASTISTPVISNAGTINSGVYTLEVSSLGCGTTTVTAMAQVNDPAALIAGSNSPLCQGSVLNLSANFIQGGTYIWRGPNGYSASGITQSITGAQPTMHSGIYTLEAVQPGCGNISTTTSIIVGGSLNQFAISGNSPLCSGSTLQLSSTSIPNTTVLWQGPGGFTSNQVNISRTNMQTIDAGVYTCTANSQGCGSISRFTDVIVNEVPVLSASSNAPLCEGSVLNLMVNSVPNASYQWSGPLGWASVGQNVSIPSVNPTRSGVYTVVVNVPGCGTTQAVTTLHVGTSIVGMTHSTNSPLCLNGALNLNSTSRSGVTYLWQGPGGFTSNTASAVRSNMQGSDAGIYTLTVNSPGCGSFTSSMQVLVNNPAVATASNNGPLCGGAVLTLNGTGNRSSTYAWAGPNGFNANTANVSINNAQSIHAGEYTLTVNDPGCGPIVLTTTAVVGSNLNAAAATNNGPICAGSNIQLSATTIPGVTYAWTGPDGFTSNLQNPIIPNADFVNSGQYSLMVSSAGCLSVHRTTEVTILPAITAVASSNAPICQGGVIYFNGSFVPNATYAWSGPNGFVSSVQNPALVNAQPISSGTYTLTVSRAGCDPSIATTVVQIGSALNTITAAYNGPLCTGNTLMLSATSVSGLSYSWTGPDGFTSTLAQPQISNISALNAGQYQVMVQSPGCGTVTRSLSVVVNSAPVLLAGNSGPICQGNVLYLSVNTVSGATYSWTGPNAFQSTVQNPAISNAQPIRSGEYSLTVNAPGCGSITATTQVMVGSNLTGVNILSNSPVCAGSSLLLSAMDKPGFTFSWTGPNGFTSTLAQPVLPNATTADEGTYTVVFNSAGCGSASRSVSIRVNDPALVTASNTSPVCVNGVVYFSSSAPTGSTYSWAGPGGFVATTQAPARTRVQLAHAGMYSMTANVPGCGNVTATTQVVVNVCRDAQNQDIKSFDAQEVSAQNESLNLAGSNAENVLSANTYTLKAWPNPGNGEFVHLRWEGLSGADKDITVKVYDATGKTMLVKSVSRTNPLQTSIDNTLEFAVRLAKGIYTIETVHDGIWKYEKLIVE